MSRNEKGPLRDSLAPGDIVEYTGHTTESLHGAMRRRHIGSRRISRNGGTSMTTLNLSKLQKGDIVEWIGHYNHKDVVHGDVGVVLWTSLHKYAKCWVAAVKWVGLPENQKHPFVADQRFLRFTGVKCQP